MPNTNKDGVQTLTDADLEALKSDPTKIDDATLQKMAEKSGDTVAHMREVLGLYGDGDASKNTDENLLAGKYKTEEDLDQGIQSLIDKYGKETTYKMLEANVGKQSNSDNADNGDNTGDNKDALSGDADDDNTNTEATGDNSGDNASDSSGKPLDLNEFYDEYANKGALTEDSYKALEKAGFDKDVVDSYIEGQTAIKELFTNNVHSLAGGEEQFNAMVEWGTASLKDAEKSRFNDAINSGNITQATTAIEALKARYEANEGTFTRNHLSPNDTATGMTPQGYQSVQEMQRDMQDPRYRSGDAAFIKSVASKIKNSKIM